MTTTKDRINEEKALKAKERARIEALQKRCIAIEDIEWKGSRIPQRASAFVAAFNESVMDGFDDTTAHARAVAKSKVDPDRAALDANGGLGSEFIAALEAFGVGELAPKLIPGANWAGCYTQELAKQAAARAAIAFDEGDESAMRDEIMRANRIEFGG